MTMTNDEINTKIARLHGWHHFPPPAMPAWQRPTDHGMEEMFDLTDWAGGPICKAWELVDEITRQDGYSVEVRDNGRSFNSVCVITEDGGIITVTSSDTAPRAICLAYIAWKER